MDGYWVYWLSVLFKYGKPDWHSVFNFEFSSNGEDRYTGEVELIGVRVMRTEVPPHRV